MTPPVLPQKSTHVRAVARRSMPERSQLRPEIPIIPMLWLQSNTARHTAKHFKESDWQPIAKYFHQYQMERRSVQRSHRSIMSKTKTTAYYLHIRYDAVKPPGSGVPVPGATEGSSPSMSKLRYVGTPDPILSLTSVIKGCNDLYQHLFTGNYLDSIVLGCSQINRLSNKQNVRSYLYHFVRYSTRRCF